MLALINNVWEGGCLPKEWKHAVIIPIVKPGKQADSPSSYRPIALTSVLCKIMERMITDRLVDKLENPLIRVDLGREGRQWMPF